MSCVNSVRVVPSQLTLTHHDTFSGLQAIVDTNGSDCCGVRWMSGDTSVVTVDRFTGQIEAVGVGTTYVKASAIDGSGKYGCCTVTVEQLYVTSVRSCPENRAIRVGEYFNLSGWVYPGNATNSAVTFTSNNTSIATVSAAGKVVRINELLSEATGKSVKQIHRDTERDCFMWADQACEYGIVDYVIERIAEISDNSNPI